MKPKNKYVITLETESKDFKDTIVELFEYFDWFGSVGASREIFIGINNRTSDLSLKDYPFSKDGSDPAPIKLYVDGDGADRFKNDIKIETIEQVSEGIMKITRKQLDSLIESKVTQYISSLLKEEQTFQDIQQMIMYLEDKISTDEASDLMSYYNPNAEYDEVIFDNVPLNIFEKYGITKDILDMYKDTGDYDSHTIDNQDGTYTIIGGE